MQAPGLAASSSATSAGSTTHAIKSFAMQPRAPIIFPTGHNSSHTDTHTHTMIALRRAVTVRPSPINRLTIGAKKLIRSAKSVRRQAQAAKRRASACRRRPRQPEENRKNKQNQPMGRQFANHRHHLPWLSLALFFPHRSDAGAVLCPALVGKKSATCSRTTCVCVCVCQGCRRETETATRVDRCASDRMKNERAVVGSGRRE